MKQVETAVSSKQHQILSSRLFVIKLETRMGRVFRKLRSTLAVVYQLLTGDHVSESDGGHGDEAEVDGVEEAPVLVDGEQVRAHLRQSDIIS